MKSRTLRMPSVRTLVNDLYMTSADARLIRRIGHAAHSAETLRPVLESDPRTAPLAIDVDRSLNDGWLRTYALRGMDRVLGTHGVESFEVPGNSMPVYPSFEYLNAGDAYAATLVYHHHARAIRVGCWGDIAERFRRDDE
jgi:hypothetical protein